VLVPIIGKGNNLGALKGSVYYYHVIKTADVHLINFYHLIILRGYILLNNYYHVIVGKV